MKVTTVRLVDAPGSTSSSLTPGTASISRLMASIFSAIPALAEIGDALDELHDPTPLRTVYLSEPLRS